MSHQIAVFSLKDDVHGLIVQDALRKRGVVCHFVATNDLIASGGLVWSHSGSARIRSDEGEWFEIAELDAIWWRRVYQQQLPHEAVTEPELLRLATAEWRGALLGALLGEFHGAWLNDPYAGRRAEHKIVQLRAAQAVGLRIPPTYVGQDPLALRAFCAEHGLGRMVLKKVQGTVETALLTVPITPDDLWDDASIALCPAIYQGEVPGRVHLRLHVFGDRVIAVALESDALDWRPDLNIPMRRFDLDAGHAARLIALNHELGLEMSIMDAKLSDDGDLVWLEANPQGAFAFAEALAEVDITGALCDLLMERASGGTHPQPPPNPKPRRTHHRRQHRPPYEVHHDNRHGEILKQGPTGQVEGGVGEEPQEGTQRQRALERSFGQSG